MARGYGVNKRNLLELKQARDKLGRFTKRINVDVDGVLHEEVARIVAEARLEVPVDSGDLRDSIKGEVTGSPLHKTMQITASSVHRGYDYAGKQHDDLSLNHPNGGKAYFISDPFFRGVDRVSERLEEVIDDELYLG